MNASGPVTLDDLDEMIAITAYVMRRHNLPQILPTLKRLEAARDDLLTNGDPLEYAGQVLEHSTKQINVAAYLPDCRTDPSRPSAYGAS